MTNKSITEAAKDLGKDILALIQRYEADHDVVVDCVVLSHVDEQSLLDGPYTCTNSVKIRSANNRNYIQ